MPVVSMKQLLEAGVHFGHQTRRWNPKMKPYIFTERNGIYIIDLQKTLGLMETAYNFIRDVASKGDQILFVGTKKQAQESIKEESEKAFMPYINHRWMGGMLTNYRTIRMRIDRLEEIDRMTEDGSIERYSKKERLKIMGEREKLDRNLGGIRSMPKIPGAIYVVDPRKEHIAIKEARRLSIPIVAIVDTNCDPDEVDYIIPGNDDAIRAVTLITRIMADAALHGAEIRQAQTSAAEAEEEEEKAKAAPKKPAKPKEEKAEAEKPEAKKAKEAPAKEAPAKEAKEKGEGGEEETPS